MAEAKELADLNTKRSSLKGQITKFRNYLNSLARKESLTRIELAQLNVKLSKFEALSDKFEDLQSEIEVLNSASLSLEIEEREKIEEEIVNNIAFAKILIERFEPQGSTNSDESRRRQSEFNNSFEQREMGFKLPQIQISKFDGAYFRWLEFRDTFESLIHNEKRIAPIHKFHYLISYLEGEAARIVSNLEMSSDNYEVAWKLLCERYNNKRQLTNHHLNALFNIQPFSRETERSLRFLVDHVTKNLRALNTLGQPTGKWDTLIIFMLSSKLDSRTLLKWEEYRNDFDEYPTLDQFKKFITDRADVLESLNRNKPDNNNPKNLPSTSRSSAAPINHKPEKSNYTKSYAAFSKDAPTYLCVICCDNHKIYDCPVFKSKSLQERMADCKKYNLCINCLRQGHPVTACRMGPCIQCKKRHNTLLHNTNPPAVANSAVMDPSEDKIIVNFSKPSQNQVLLSTAMIEVSNPKTNKVEKVRALLDCGSESSFITKSLQEKLSLNTTSIDAQNVIGIGNTSTNTVVECCTAKINSLNTSFSVTLPCYILNEITSELPKAPIDIQALKLPTHVQLADPNFHQPSSADMLIGADIFWDILGNNQISLGSGYPKLRSSKLGWLISGPINTIKQNINYKTNTIKQNKNIHCNHGIITNQSSCKIDDMLTTFWDLEEVPQKTHLTENEKSCERHFLANTSRSSDGRFCVKLPLVDTPDCLGDSHNLAKKRFLNLEKKFRRNPNLKTEYSNFIKEYYNLGHLSESVNPKPDNSYFLCHHAVFKEDSESTKLRVVFDGSAPSSSGYSLNDILMVGPNVQNSLFSILIRARQYKFLLTGDIEKMYRQVQVHESDRDLQLILWREDERQPIKTLRLNTLTYGTASASYLSTRCLWQVGEEQDDSLIKNIIQNDFFVDDLITGSDDENQLRYIQKSVSEALNTGCFNLRKYKSNLPTLFQNSSINIQENLKISESSSTLGLGWDPSKDVIHFPTKNVTQNEKITKRFIMSSSFQIFDPLGLLSPCIIQPKIILQSLWQQKIDWDQAVPENIKNEWDRFTKNLPYLKTLQIPRVVLCNSPVQIEMHSFSDASQHAYGACIYMRSVDCKNDVTVRLLCAKSRVAPLKPTTIPRLELCAALLAARLTRAVADSLRYQPSRIVYWCDSSIVQLGWIHSDDKKLKTFVANRIGEIRDSTQSSSWRYVPTECNPADLISRGVDASKLVKLKLWWLGPDYLLKDESEWPLLTKNICENLPEIKSTSVNISDPFINFKSYSKLTKLQRSFAYVKRFIYNLKNPQNKHTGCLKVDELKESFYFLCSMAQKETFTDDYNLLKKGNPLNCKSKILSLSPFLDKDLIRVGGRIDASNYAFEKKHPILLHSSHHLTRLLFEREHLRNLHAGPQLLLATVRETVWPINGRHLARRTVNRCVRCRRLCGKTLCPKMGDLPSQRITPDFPFLTVGLDFAGPFYILNRKGRGSRLIKCYLCLFICLRYKCLHLEGVSDLTKDAFVMTLRRFIARRGKPAEILCDNGRNFVAAAKEIGNFLKSNIEPISDYANQEGIKFTFTPTYAPHFGGIWEAGVKSAKYHIRRVMGNSHLTFEEISTLFAQVEAILNSRPLYPLSSSPNDLLSLSPGHFIIGRPLTALPSPVSENCSKATLQRYIHLEKLRKDFWQRWQKEYICELQQRLKWKSNKAQLAVGDLVLLQEDNAPPLQWRLGRVARLFPGPDGVARVADVNTLRGCVRRPLIRLCPLPAEEDFKS